MEKFDNAAHEQQVSDRYAQLARAAAFDRIIDMALDGVITVAEAIKCYIAEELPDGAA